MNQKFLTDEEHNCTECEKRLKKGQAVWLELELGTCNYYFHGVPNGKKSQGWHPFGSTCAKKIRLD